MRLDRPVRLLVLLAFLAGPFGLLSVDHAEFHACSGDGAHDEATDHRDRDQRDRHDGHPDDRADNGTGACPVCHAAGTPGLDAPGQSAHTPALALEGSLPIPPDAHPAVAALAAPRRSRAPPALS